LDEAFEGIAAATAQAEKNLHNARELFQSVLQSTFSQKGDDWVEATLDALGQITSSKRIFKSEYQETGIPFYRTKEIKELANERAVSTELFISNERYSEIREKFGVPQLNDLLLTAIGTIGEIYVVENSEPFYFKDGNVLWLKDFESVDPNFLKYILGAFVEELARLSHGSAYNALPIQKLKEHPVSLPPLPTQQAIVEKLDALSEETKALEAIYERKQSALAELKQSLLQKAFAGEL
jgi:type I restriction enzyme S subunit